MSLRKSTNAFRLLYISMCGAAHSKITGKPYLFLKCTTPSRGVPIREDMEHKHQRRPPPPLPPPPLEKPPPPPLEPPPPLDTPEER